MTTRTTGTGTVLRLATKDDVPQRQPLYRPPSRRPDGTLVPAPLPEGWERTPDLGAVQRFRTATPNRRRP